MSHQEPVYGQPQGGVNPGMQQAQPQFTPEQIAQMQAMQQAQAAQAAQAAAAQAQAQQQPQFTPEQIAQMQAMQQQQAQAQQQAAQNMPPVGGVPGTVGQMPAPEAKPELPNNFPGMAPPAEMPNANPAAQAPQGLPGQAPVVNPAMTPEQMQQQYAQVAQAQQAAQYNPAQQQQAPAGYNPAMQQQYNPAAQQQAPAGYGQPQYNPAMQQQQYNPAAQQQAPAQQMPQYNMPGQQQAPAGNPAPGYNGGSYLNNGAGVGGPTPTGHPEKQKFNGRALLVFASAADSKKQNRYCRGLLNPHPDQRNGQSYNFICFSKHSAYQIDIIDNAAIRSNFTRIEKAAGQPILFEGHWEWNTGGQTPAWQLMIEQFSFEQDPNLKIHADNYVPPIPASPMDMINGGNMGMGMGMGMAPQGQQYNPAQQYNPMGQAPAGYNPAAQQQAPMGGQYNPMGQAPTGYNPAQQPVPGYGAPMGGQYNPAQQQMAPGQYPGMPGQHQ